MVLTHIPDIALDVDVDVDVDVDDDVDAHTNRRDDNKHHRDPRDHVGRLQIVQVTF